MKPIKPDKGVQFGNWCLVPSGMNWELYHWTKSRENATTVKRGTANTWRWAPLGRYYQANTIHLALEYAADQEMSARATRRASAIREALDEYRAILDEFRMAFSAN